MAPRRSLASVPLRCRCLKLGWVSVTDRFALTQAPHGQSRSASNPATPAGSGPPLVGLPDNQASAYFDRTAGYWRDIYEQPSVQGLVYRERFGRVLDWCDRLMAQGPGRIL